jgi:hypothetical protein
MRPTLRLSRSLRRQWSDVRLKTRKRLVDGRGDNVTDGQRLTLLRAVHTAIYVLMSASTFAVLYAAVAGIREPWVWVALSLLVAEITVFVGNGMKCPFTAAAMRYGARLGDEYVLPGTHNPPHAHLLFYPHRDQPFAAGGALGRCPPLARLHERPDRGLIAINNRNPTDLNVISTGGTSQAKRSIQ